MIVDYFFIFIIKYQLMAYLSVFASNRIQKSIILSLCLKMWENQRIDSNNCMVRVIFML